MKTYVCMLACFFVLLSSPAHGTVAISSPVNGITVGTSTQYTASGTTGCAQGVASMGVYVDNTLTYVTQGAALNTTLPLSVGSHSTYVQEWDNCGGSSGAPVQLTATTQSGLFVSSPINNTQVTPDVTFLASANTPCSQGIKAIDVLVNNQVVAASNGSVLNTRVTLPVGLQQAVVEAWDNCGNSRQQTSTLLVKAPGATGSANGGVFTQIQAVGNWNQWGELPPDYGICAPCTGITWNMTQNISSGSLSGSATRFDLGGTAPYGDVLWSNKLIGQGTTENIPDTSQSILPTLHNLTYDADIYVTNAGVTQDLEFDVNMYMGGVGMEWGTECDNLAGSDWDIWDNVNARWVPTGAPCKFNNNGWNHVTIEVQRLGNNQLLYKTLTINGVTANINQIYPPFSVPAGWYGMTVNYQMDGDYKMSANTTYVDNLTVQYW